MPGVVGRSADGESIDPVLLVIVGALGDLAWRKFIASARIVAESFGRLPDKSWRVEVRLIDLLWNDATWRLSSDSLRNELRYRIGRRLIELCAEEVSDWQRRTNRRVLLQDPLIDPLPWDVTDFYRAWVDPVSAVEARRDGCRIPSQAELEERLTGECTWFTPRFGYDAGSRDTWVEQARAEGRKIAVFVATPPQAYPQILRDWGKSAHRIVLEKPAVGLDASLGYAGTSQLLDAARSVDCELATNDHYNSKLVTRAMDRFGTYRLFEHLLTPGRITRIVVQLVEGAPLPPSRARFFDGCGGPFGDMVPHLLQAVRAVVGADRLGNIRCTFSEDSRDFFWARYNHALTVPSSPDPPYRYEPLYYSELHDTTETFVAFKSMLTVEGSEIELWCRTGKGLQPPRKSIRVDCVYDRGKPKDKTKGKTVSMIFDLARSTIGLRDDANGFALETGPLKIQETSRLGTPASSEYEGIFEDIVRTPWKKSLDQRRFPSLRDATNVAHDVITALQRERGGRNSPIHRYEVGDPPPSWRDDEAHWE